MHEYKYQSYIYYSVWSIEQVCSWHTTWCLLRAGFLPLYVQLLISIRISLNDFLSTFLSPEVCFCPGAYCTSTSDFASSWWWCQRSWGLQGIICSPLFLPAAPPLSQFLSITNPYVDVIGREFVCYLIHSTIFLCWI